ncbi:hypothetical protein [Microbacterium esteraromaticum]|uniref:hypothetical protein n=1 Tax=Microbacterium esteraromaticum TaxID=57043 RepID=UPI00195D2270|nr:hypothetical protein [Microbacterium esteraromaticum]MBM7466058.1 uncharacterized protein YdhG (YjbR/CyaY superfamily) [Microbacterium esteraromaticum]
MSKTEQTANFTDAEREAMKARASEGRAARSRAKKDPAHVRAEGEAEVRAKLADMPDDDRELGERLHAMVAEVAPHLVPKTYYGMPAYANEAGKVVCFYKPRSKFKVRYSTFEFDQAAKLDDGAVWPTAYAVTALGDDEIAFLAERVRLAAS